MRWRGQSSNWTEAQNQEVGSPNHSLTRKPSPKMLWKAGSFLLAFSKNDSDVYPWWLCQHKIFHLLLLTLKALSYIFVLLHCNFAGLILTASYIQLDFPGIGLKEQRQGRDAGAVSGVIKVEFDDWHFLAIFIWKLWFFIPPGGQGSTDRCPCNLPSKVGSHGSEVYSY